MIRIYIPLISALFVSVSVCNFSCLAHVIFQVLNMQQNNASQSVQFLHTVPPALLQPSNSIPIDYELTQRLTSHTPGILDNISPCSGHRP
jgi:hypothetical protein